MATDREGTKVIEEYVFTLSTDDTGESQAPLPFPAARFDIPSKL